MAHLFGIRGDGGGSTGPPYVPASYYAYRRSDDYYFAFILPIPLFNVGSSAPSYATTTFVESENENGQVRCDYAASIAPVDTNVIASTYGNNFIPWALLSGSIETNDPRVTYNLDINVTTADFLPDVPAHRWESDQLFIDATLPGYSGRKSWQFKTPLPLTAGFEFNGETYLARGIITHTGADSYGTLYARGDATNGRFIHLDYFYGGPNSIGATCAVHGTNFRTFAEEVAHNSLSFRLGDGAVSRTFETTQSEVPFPATAVSGTLTYSSNSEVAGAHSGRVFYPSIVRVAAEFVEPLRLRVDATNSLSPTATILGIVVCDADTPNGRPTPTPNLLGRYLIDHYEVGGESYPVDRGGPGNYIPGDYIPSRVFDIIFKEPPEGSEETPRTTYLELRAVVDADALPPVGETLPLNYMMSIQALLYATLIGGGEVIQTKAIVRPYGDLKGRPGSQLWQYKKNSHDIYAGEVGSGKGNVLVSSDEGETWQLMANAWTGVSGAKPLGFTALPPSAAISMAKVGTNIQTRYSPDKGQTWDAPVTVCPYATGSWIIASHEYSGQDDITIANQTTDAKYISTEHGAEGSWESAT